MKIEGQRPKKISNEIKVGFLAFVTLGIIFIFARLIGGSGPFQSKHQFYLTYNFAGGIEKGSPVRLAGVKVGKVEEIEFLPLLNSDLNLQNPPVIKLKVSVSPEAMERVRKDSSFYINLAGLIGERYIEITSGTLSSEKIQDLETLRGIDPPRIDQLISQSFNLAGRIQEFINHNESKVIQSLELINQLTVNINKALVQIDRSKLLKSNMSVLIDNLVDASRDLKQITAKTSKIEIQAHLDLMMKLLKRLDEIKKEDVTQFLQKEGIRARIF